MRLNVLVLNHLKGEASLGRLSRVKTYEYGFIQLSDKIFKLVFLCKIIIIFREAKTRQRLNINVFLKYNNCPLDPEILVVIDRWSLFRGHLCRKGSIWWVVIDNSGCYLEVVVRSCLTVLKNALKFNLN